MTDRPYLSIGDVLALLRDEFPDVTISKIRFLESRGLLDPERTPSGYRKFYEQDVERLRWILRQQREHFLPLKIIKGRLEGSAPAEEPASLFDVPDEPTRELADDRALVGAVLRMSEAGGSEQDAAGRWPPAAGEDPLVRDPEQPKESRAHGQAVGDSAAHPTAERGPTAVEARGGQRSRHAPDDPPEDLEADAPVLEVTELHADGDDADATAETPAVTPAESDEAPHEGRRRSAGLGATAGRRAMRSSAGALAPARSGTEDAGPPAAPPRPRRRGRSPETGASMTPAELADASGLEVADIERLEEYGLLTSRMVAGVRCYDEEGLVVARLAAGFARYGVEARHLRTFKHAADREAGLFEQVVIPLLRQRNPDARARANASLEELTELGAALQASLLAAALRDVTG